MSAPSTADLLQDALALHRLGALDEASARYARVLRAEPANGDALYYLAMISCQRGNFADGADLARQSLATDPRQARGHVLLGRALSALARADEALASFERAVALEPDLAQAHGNRGTILSDLGRFVEAIESYDRALALMPDSVEDWFNRGLALAGVRRREEAVASFDRALALKPDFAVAQFHRANALVELKRYDDALVACERVLAIEPSNVGALMVQGIALGMLGRHAASLASFDRAQSIKPDVVEVLVNRGCALNALEEFDDALENFARALAQAPDHVAALNHRGIAQFGLGQFAQARASFERVLELDPDHADAHFNCGLALTKLRLAAEARASFQRALTLDPDHTRVLGELAKGYVFACDWAALDQIRGDMMQRVARDRALVEPFLLLAIESTPAEQLACAQTWLADIVGRGRENYPPRRHRAADKIRLAYVSADFRQHATSHLLADIIESHDRTRFEVIAVSVGPDDGSGTRARIVKAFDAFHDLRNDGSETVAKFLYDQNAHVAVDLKGYTEFARPGVFAPRPAPVQVNFLGYPGTTGAAFMDYIVADPIVLPFDQQPFYTEKIIHLPDTYQPNDSRRKMLPLLPSRREAGLATDKFVFCCFNNTYKITAPIFDVWMRLLGKVDGSVLWLYGGDDLAVANLSKAAQARGIETERIVFAPPLPHADHLARHALADLFLDTLPYNAHTTASDALWAGLPVLTLKGDTFAGRVAASLLHAVGLPELVTGSLEEYETLALKLARDNRLLAQLRQRLRENISSAPLFDTDRYRRHLEQAYLTMVDIWQCGDAPRSFTVKPI